MPIKIMSDLPSREILERENVFVWMREEQNIRISAQSGLEY